MVRMKLRHHICTLLLLPICARADSIAYSGTHEVKVTKDTLTFRHVHNWSSPKVDELYSDLTHHERFFSAANDFAFVELRDGNRVLFRSPSPALTHLWISTDSQFFVGLSNVMLYNPYQLVVWKRDGRVAHCEHVSAEVAKVSAEQRREFAKRFPSAEKFLSGRYFTHNESTYLDYSLLGVPNEIGDAAWNYLYPFRVRHPYSDDFSESVTNSVFWFDDKDPELNLFQEGARLTLSLRSRTGKRVFVPIQKGFDVSSGK
jgi:hypothetical protein